MRSAPRSTRRAVTISAVEGTSRMRPVSGPHDSVDEHRDSVDAQASGSGSADRVAPGSGQKSRASILVRGSSWQVLAQVAPLVVNLVLTPFVITRLGVTAYGFFVLTSMLTQFLSQFDGGIGRSAQRFFMLYAGRNDPVAATRLLVSLLLLVLGVSMLTLGTAIVLAPSIMVFFHAPPDLFADAVLLLRVLSVIVAIALARNLFASVLYSHQRFAITSGTLLLGYLVYAVGIVVVLNAGMGLAGLAYVFIAQQAVGTMTIVPSACRHLSRRGIGFISRSELREFLGFTWKVQISGLLGALTFQGVTMIVGRMVPAQLAYFAPGATFAQQLRMLPNNAMVPIQTMLGRAIGHKGAAAAVEDYAAIQRMWVPAVCGWVAVGAPTAYFGVNNWLPLGGVLPGLVAGTLLCAHLFAMLQSVLLQWAMLLGRPSYEVWAQALNAVLTLILSPLFIRGVGAFGVALALLAGQLTAFLYLATATRRLPVRVPSVFSVVPLGRMLLAAALSFACGYGMDRLLAAGSPKHGALALLACALAAVPAAVFYVGTTIGIARVRDLIRRRKAGSG